MDPLSDVLSLLKPKNYLAAGLEAGGDWSIQFPDQGTVIKCGVVVSGRCWLAVEGVDDPVRLETGDCFLLPSGRPFRLATDMALPPVAAASVFVGNGNGGIVAYRGGGDFSLVSCRFAIADAHAGVLLGVLPRIVHIGGDADGATLRWPVERMMQEMRARQPGGILVIEHLAQMMLVEALRLHLTRGSRGVGWLFALADRQMAAAIAAIHGDPGRRWTLATLASAAGMSRSAFALRFKARVGTSPMDYLTRWRMLLAADRLAQGSDPIAAIAASLGYNSESAFGTAFKRVTGRPPRQQGRIRPPAAAGPLRQDRPPA